MSRQDRAELTRSQILESAAEVFVDVGYSGANVNDIVAKANVTKGALYFHFESKAFLAHALIEERDRLVDEIMASIETAKMPALEKLIHGSLAIAGLADSEMFFRAGDQLLFEVGDFRATPGSSVQRSLCRVARLVSAAMEERDLAEGDPSRIAHLMTMQFVGARVMARAAEPDLELFSYLGDMWNMLIKSLANDHVQPYFQQLVARMIAMHLDAEVSPEAPVTAAR